MLKAVSSSSSGGGSGVTSVTAANTTLTISPNTGDVLASLNLNNANNWTAAQTITVSSGSVTPLTVVNAGTGDSFRVDDSTAPDATPFIIDANGRTIIGYTAALNVTDTNNTLLQVYHVTSARAAAAFGGFGADALGPRINFLKSRSGVIGSFGIVTNGDILGELNFTGDDGTDYLTNGARIRAAVDGATGANDMPGRLEFSTTADGANAVSERMRINSAGAVLINQTATDGTSILQVTGQAVIAGNLKLQTAGNALYIKTGTNGMFGDVTLVAGVGTVSIAGLTTSDRAFTNLIVVGGVMGARILAVCTANTLTITAITTSGATVATDTSTYSYVIIRPS